MYKALGTFISRHWVVVLLVWVVAALAIAPRAQRALGIRFTPTWDEVTKDGDLAYLPPRMTSVKGQKLYINAFPDNKSRSDIVVLVERTEGLQQGDLDYARQIGAFFQAEKATITAFGPPSIENKAEREKHVAVVDVMLPASNLEGKLNNGAEDLIGQKLISPDKQAAIVIASLEHELIAIDSARTLNMMLAKFKADEASGAKPAGLNVALTGSAAVGGDTLLSSDESIQNIHTTTGILVLVILLIVYRAPILVFVPLVTIGVAVFVANNLIALLTQLSTVPGFSWFHFEIFKTSEIFIFTICFGSGTDFCLFLISRYKEEMERGLDKGEALKESLEQVGEALVGSAMTTVCGLGMMYFADFGKFTYSGPAIALCLTITLMACMTLAPAILRGFGRTVFWPTHLTHKPAAVREHFDMDDSRITRFWRWTSDHILRYPGMILMASVIVMTPLAYEGLQVKISYDLLADLENKRPSKIGTEMMRKHFPAGEIGPISMLVDKKGADFTGEEGRKHITDLTKELYALSKDEIKSVRSLTYPLGDAPKRTGIFGGLQKSTLAHHKETEAKFVAMTGDWKGEVTRFDVITAYDPFSTQAENVLGKLEGMVNAKALDPDSPWYGATFAFIGTTAGTRDLKAVVTSDEWIIQRLVVLSVSGVVLWILRRPLICAYLIFTVIFSYLVTIGATELVFQWMYADFEGLDWKVPIFLFVILVAVGEDYNIYLATRVFEEERRLGRIPGLRMAIIKTGGIITSCGVIMAGTFISLMSGTLRAMHALGFALTLGVILDTFIVRPVLVPAFLAWLYKVMPESIAAAASAAPEAATGEPLGETGAAIVGSPVMNAVTVPAKPHTERSRRAAKRHS
jgi:RND superfamily putative drug exporter